MKMQETGGQEMNAPQMDMQGMGAQQMYEQPMYAQQMAAPASNVPAGKKKKKFIPIIIILLILIVTGVGILAYLNSTPVKLKKQLALGDKYLLEEDYEQAIAEYQIAIEIDPLSEEALEGLKKAYMGYVEELEKDDIDAAIELCYEAYDFLDEDEDFFDKGVDLYLKKAAKQAKSNDFDAAIATLKDGLKEYDSDKLRKQIEKYKEEKAAYEHEQKQKALLAQVDHILTEIAKRCSESNWDGVFELMNSDDYNQFLSIVDKLDTHSAMDTGYGLLGIYRINDEVFGDYMIYYGDYAGDARSGHGYWIGYYNGNNHLDEGEWVNDKPNGYHSIKEWYNQLVEGTTYRVLSGNVVDGLWDGEMQWGFETINGGVNIWNVTFHNGILEAKGKNFDGKFIMGTNGSGDLAADEVFANDIHGIIGYAGRR